MSFYRLVFQGPELTDVFIVKLIRHTWFYGNTPKILRQFFNVTVFPFVSTLVVVKSLVFLIKVKCVCGEKGFGSVESEFSVGRSS